MLTTIHWVKWWGRKENHKSELNRTAGIDWLALASTSAVAASAGLSGVPDLSCLWTECFRTNLVSKSPRMLTLFRQIGVINPTFLLQNDQVGFWCITQSSLVHQPHTSNLLGCSRQWIWWSRLQMCFLVYICCRDFFFPWHVSLYFQMVWNWIHRNVLPLLYGFGWILIFLIFKTDIIILAL